MSEISQTIGDFAGTNRENRKRFYLSDSSPTILDYRGCLRFMVFISRENLGGFGNSEIPDRLGFSRHMKTKLYKNNTLKRGSFRKLHTLSVLEFILCKAWRGRENTFLFRFRKLFLTRNILPTAHCRNLSYACKISECCPFNIIFPVRFHASSCHSTSRKLPHLLTHLP